MLYKIKSNVVNLVEIKGIDVFPIPIHTIQDVLYSHGYELHHVDGLVDSCIIGNKLIYPKYETKKGLRLALAHELGHIIMHECDAGYCELTHTQEWEADAFALYFTMPPKTFEKDMYRLTYFQLSEKYGVATHYVKMRVGIAEQMVS